MTRQPFSQGETKATPAKARALMETRRLLA